MSHQHENEFAWREGQEESEEMGCFDACYEGESTVSLYGLDYQEVPTRCEEKKQA